MTLLNLIPNWIAAVGDIGMFTIAVILARREMIKNNPQLDIEYYRGHIISPDNGKIKDVIGVKITNVGNVDVTVSSVFIRLYKNSHNYFLMDKFLWALPMWVASNQCQEILYPSPGNDSFFRALPKTIKPWVTYSMMVEDVGEINEMLNKFYTNKKWYWPFDAKIKISVATESSHKFQKSFNN